MAEIKPKSSYDTMNIAGLLKIGSTGSAVIDIQEKLIQMGYNCGGYGADGNFGSGTYNSVIQFQRKYGLTEDGIVGPETAQAIANALKTSTNGIPKYMMSKPSSVVAAAAKVTSSVGVGIGSKYSTSNLSINMVNTYSEEVVNLQRDLTQMGYNVGGVDGYYGNDTEEAVKKFQRYNNLVEDGIAGKDTKRAIEESIASRKKWSTGSTGSTTPSTGSSSPISNATLGAKVASSVGAGTESNYTTSNLSISMVNTYSKEVAKLQSDLTQMGYNVGGIDGYYGYNTEDAVKKFQRYHNLSEDGIAGKDTKRAIEESIASRKKWSTGSTGSTTPSTGSSSPISNAAIEAKIASSVGSGSSIYTTSDLSTNMVNTYSKEVEKLQNDLTKLGYTTYGVDGYFGENTESAVRLFQQNHGLVVDGIAGRNTKNEVIKALSNAVKSDSKGIILTDSEKKAGIKVVTIDGKQYYDYSVPIYKMVHNNILECEEMSKENLATSLMWFYNKVKTGGPWDIKVKTSWGKQFSDEVKYRDNFVLNGEVITPSELGNITYGYWGRATGYGRELLYWGGGYAAQVIEHTGKLTKDEVLMLPILENRSKWYGDYLGDIPNSSDHDNITKGVEWYNREHKTGYATEENCININPTKLLRSGASTLEQFTKVII